MGHEESFEGGSPSKLNPMGPVPTWAPIVKTTGADNLPGFHAAVAQTTVVIDVHDAEPQRAPVTMIELVSAELPNVSPLTVTKLTPLRGTLIGSECETTGESNVTAA